MALRTIIEDYRTQREGFLAQGFWALFVYRLSRPRMAIRSRLIRVPYFIINRFLQKWIEVTCGICLPEGVRVGRRLAIDHFGNIVINAGSVIGDDVTIRQGVTIGSKDAGSKGAPVLKNRIDVGAGAKIIGSITIGNDVKIGANAVVIADVPDGPIAVGVPARNIMKNTTPLDQQAISL